MIMFWLCFMNGHHFHWIDMGYITDYENGRIEGELFSVKSVRNHLQYLYMSIMVVMSYTVVVVIGLILALTAKEK